jgi:hypothetical protein
VQDSEVSFVALNDTNGNPLYIGRAMSGTFEDEEKWQIRKIDYDANQGIVRITWPENDEAAASTEYEFAWSTVDTLSVTGITKANPAVVTVSSIGLLANGDTIALTNVLGMTQVNFTGTNTYTVAGISGNTFQLQGVNSTGYGAYTSGGTVNFGEFLTYTYF